MSPRGSHCNVTDETVQQAEGFRWKLGQYGWPQFIINRVETEREGLDTTAGFHRMPLFSYLISYYKRDSTDNQTWPQFQTKTLFSKMRIYITFTYFISARKIHRYLKILFCKAYIFFKKKSKRVRGLINKSKNKVCFDLFWTFVENSVHIMITVR